MQNIYHSFETALNLQTSLHLPHLVHSDWSILYPVSLLPLIALTGQFVKQSAHFLHFS
jgi:hypothetical protein